MVQINFALREVNVKLVYYGPGRSGKTTNLQMIHEKAPKGSIGEMMSIATETDRTLFFDFLPLDLGKVAGMNTKFQLYTVPGQVYYKATRKLVLQGADGVVFVADSQSNMMEENIQSLEDLEENLQENGLDINTIPLVLQWNKRDLENIFPVEELNEKVNRWNAPHFEAVAIKGDGVFPTLKALASVVIQKLNREHGYDKDRSSEMPSVKETPAAPAATQAAAASKPATKGDKKAAAKELAAELSASAAPQSEAKSPPPKPAPAPAVKPAAPAQAAPPPPAQMPAPPPAPPAEQPTAKVAPKKAAPKAPQQVPPAGTPPSGDTQKSKAPPPPPKPAAAPPPAPAKPAGGKKAAAQAAEGGDAVKREIEKRRQQSLKKKQEQVERIRQSRKKTIQRSGIPLPLIIVAAIILIALAVIVTYLVMS